MEKAPKDIFLQKCSELLTAFREEIGLFVPGQQAIIRKKLLQLLEQDTFSQLLRLTKRELFGCKNYWSEQFKKCPLGYQNKRMLLKSLSGKLNFTLKLLTEQSEAILSGLSDADIKNIREQLANTLIASGENSVRVENSRFRHNPALLRPEDSGVIDLLDSIREIPKTTVRKTKSGRFLKKRSQRIKEINWEIKKDEREKLKKSRRLPALKPKPDN